MRNTIMLLILIIIVIPCKGQMTFDRQINFSGMSSVDMDIEIADSIKIHTWNKQEVSIKASVNINDNKDNEGYEIKLNEEGENLIVEAGFKEDYFKGKENNCTETLICWELFIPEEIPFTVETINGNIIINGNTASIKAKTISGFIDWSVDQSCDASLQLRSITGTFYSDLNLETEQRSNSFPPEFFAKLNSGRYPVNLETISGDIFCRRAK